MDVIQVMKTIKLNLADQENFLFTQIYPPLRVIFIFIFLFS